MVARSARAISHPRLAGWWHRRRKRILALIFVAPLLVLNIVVQVGPSLGSAYFVFTEWSGFGRATWVGLANFQRMIGDRVFHKAFTNNVKWLLIFTTVPFVMGLGGAALLARVKRFAGLYQVFYILPNVISVVVVAYMWRSILHPTVGIGRLLAQYGITFLDRSFFGEPRIALYAIAFVGLWSAWGFQIVFYRAATEAIPMELYEAGLLDGTNRWQEWRHITLPGILPTVVFLLLMAIIGSFRVFGLVFIITQGGPAHASEVLATEVQTAAFQRFEVGYAAAVGLTMSFIAVLVMIGFSILRRTGREI